MIILTIFLLCSTGAFSQNTGDDILLNENAIQRPVTLHKYQIRAGVGYIFHIFNSEYNSEGSKLQLSESGNAAARMDVPLRFQYGLLEILELSADLNYVSQSWREPQLQLYNSLEGITTINTFTGQKGIPLINFNINARVPWDFEALDVMGKLGYGIPLASPEKPQPEHSVRSSNGERLINYNWNLASGPGTAYVNTGFLTKIRLDKMAFIISWESSFPTSTSQGISWRSQLDGDAFEYISSDYRFLAPRIRDFSIRADYLAYPWFDIILQIDNQTRKRAWSEESGKQVAAYNTSETLLSPGFEILVTHRLWLRQRITLPFGGKSTLTSTSIQTFLSYNLITK